MKFKDFMTKTVDQGKVVVQPDTARTGKGGKTGFLMMFPDGVIEWKPDKASVERAAKSWFKKNLKPSDVGIGKIEWRK
jgi:hypothetical protein